MVHWGVDGWQTVRDTLSEDWALAHVAILPPEALRGARSLQFTLRLQTEGWIGEDFHIDIIGDS